MRRRDFIRYAAGAGAALALEPRVADAVAALEDLRHIRPGQGIEPLPAATYRRRLDRLRSLMGDNGLAAVFCEPATSFEYLAGASFGRSERLIALLVPARGTPVIVAPGFEVERVRAAVRSVTDIRGWAEQEDPYKLVASTLWSAGPGRVAIEPSVRFGVARNLQQALPGWELLDGTSIFARLRIIKSEEELRLIRRAVSITEVSIAATFAHLEAGASEREVASYLSQQMRQQGARGGGLVQFGPGSAVPHGGAGDRRLERGMPVLIDAGCRVHGYRSDITRMHFFGDEPSLEYREVFNIVLAAQRAAYEAGRPGMECQQLDRIARRVIREAGYAKNFTHRLGHGMGMDGHEPPYLVEGNRRKLEPGMVFTIEPGIYLPGFWGVRIEDDFVVREDRLEPLSSREAPI